MIGPKASIQGGRRVPTQGRGARVLGQLAVVLSCLLLAGATIASDLAIHYPPLPSVDIGSFNVAPDDPDVLYTGMYSSDTAPFRSRDRGVTWTSLAVPPGDPPLPNFSFLIHVQDSETLYTTRRFSGANDDVLVRSIDGGNSWSEVLRLPSTTDFSGGFELVSTPQVVYARHRSGLYRSLNRGGTWSKQYSSLQSSSVPSSKVQYFPSAIDPGNPDRLFAAQRKFFDIAARTPPGYFAASSDGGKTWQVEESEFGYAAAAVQPATGRPYRVPALSDRVEWLDDNGVWSTAGPLGLASVDVVRLAFSAEIPTTLYAGSDRKIVVSRDEGRSWSVLHQIPPSPGPLSNASIIGFSPASEDVWISRRTDAGRELVRVLPELAPVWFDAFSLGQGVFLLPRTDGSLWGAWTFYDQQGKPTWLVFQGTPYAGTMTADLLRFSGPAPGLPWDETAVQSVPVGTVSLTLRGSTSVLFTADAGGVVTILSLEPF